MRKNTGAVKIALIGAGNRGQGAFGEYAKLMPQRAQFVAVVEPDAEKRNYFGDRHAIPAERRFASLDEFFRQPPAEVEAVIIATLESLRIEPLRRSMEQHWQILIEKPLGRNAEEFLELYDLARHYPEICIVCHQLRLAPGYRLLKQLLDSGRYGRIMSIDHTENVCFKHYAHSFVRGNFRNDTLSPMLLTKSCHDLDLLSYLIGQRAVRVASFGSLKYFKRENCPAGAPEFCYQNCPHAEECPYNALRFYFDPDLDACYLRNIGAYPYDPEKVRTIMQSTNYGRCVFQSDNNVVDSQSVQIEYTGGINVNFLMTAHNAVHAGGDRRLTKISLTNGEIFFNLVETKITAWSFSPEMREEFEFTIPSSGHSGSDRKIMDNFTEAILSGSRKGLVSEIEHSLDGHLLVFAAEAARHERRVVELDAFETDIRDAYRARRAGKEQ